MNSNSSRLCEAWVSGVPKAQPRARAFSRGGRVRMFDPGTASAWKEEVALELRRHRPSKPIERPVMLCVEFFMPRPLRLQRRQDPEEAILMTAKPDVDNLLKAIMDALTDDGWWDDDALVCTVVASKSYAAKNASSGARIQICLLPEDGSVELRHERAEP